MATDLRWVHEYAWLRRTGRPARELDEYPSSVLEALLYEMEKAVMLAARHAAYAETQGPRRGWGVKKAKGLRAPAKFASPIYTGDAKADEWERQIAKGQIPDLES